MLIEEVSIGVAVQFGHIISFLPSVINTFIQKVKVATISVLELVLFFFLNLAVKTWKPPITAW